MPQQYNHRLIMMNKSSVENNASWLPDYDSHTTGNYGRWDSSYGNNESSRANYADDFNYYTPYFVAKLKLDIACAVTGTLISGWFHAAMLTSQEIRSGMRNKLLCALLTVNLTVSAITLPLYLTLEIMHANYQGNWFLHTIPHALGHIQDFIGNWQIVLLICFYMSRVVNFEPTLAPLWMKILTVVYIISPSVVGLLFVSVTKNGYFRQPYHYFDEISVYASLNTIVPLSLASLFLVLTAVLKCILYPYGRLRDTRCDQLIDDGIHIDPLYPYVALLVGVLVTDLCWAISLVDRHGSTNWGYLLLVGVYMRYLRLILVPVMLLLFPDIRELIKTWRPCRRSAPTPVDLVVIYERNAV